MTTALAIADLGTVLENLSPRDLDFAQSLIAQHGRGKRLSEKQWHWVGVLVERGRAQPALDLIQPASQPAPAGDVIDLAVIADMLAKAKEHIKYPKVRFHEEAGKLCLSIAGDAARFPGSINVTDGGRYGESEFYGRIHTDGRWEPARSLSGNQADNITKALKRIAENPAQAAADHGHATGHCSFCARFLSDPRSVGVGYGPVCASRFGLPWGEVKAEPFKCSTTRQRDDDAGLKAMTDIDSLFYGA